MENMKVIKGIFTDRNDIDQILQRFKKVSKKGSIVFNNARLRSNKTIVTMNETNNYACVGCNVEVNSIVHGSNINDVPITLLCSSKTMFDSSVIFTVDHIVPKRLGGTDHATNLQVMCHKCNVKKGHIYSPNTNYSDFLEYECYIKTMIKASCPELLRDRIDSNMVVKQKQAMYNRAKTSAWFKDFNSDIFNEAFAYVIKFSHIIFE